MKVRYALLLSLAAALVSAPAFAATETAPPKKVDGKYVDADGNPTYRISPDGTVDWYTFSGYRRFNSTCEVCHGFDGAGSSFGPDLTQSLKTLSYSDFLGIVSSGKQDVNAAQQLVMPAFGTNKNAICYIDDLYVYLRARAVGGLPTGRPAKHEDKPKEAIDDENSCMGP